MLGAQGAPETLIEEGSMEAFVKFKLLTSCAFMLGKINEKHALFELLGLVILQSLLLLVKF